jgi:hypothetical protein
MVHTVGNIISPIEDATENAAEIRLVTSRCFSVHKKPVAKVEAIPMPTKAEPTYKIVASVCPATQRVIEPSAVEHKLKMSMVVGLVKWATKIATNRAAANDAQNVVVM